MSPRKANRLCCVVGCNNTVKSTRHFIPPVHFYGFPGRKWESERKRKWIQFVNRKLPDGSPWEPKYHSVICSQHFVDNERSEEALSPSYYPTILPPAYGNRAVDSSQTLQRFNSQTVPYKCEVCKMIFESDKEKNNHNVLMHEQLHTCVICEKTFSQSCLLEQHLISHNGNHFSDDPLKCDVCGKAFTKIHLLKQHRRLHDQKPYSCNLCLKSFSTERELYRHETVHGPKQSGSMELKKSKQLSCEVCGTVFDLVNDFMRHLYSHEERGMYQCFICNRKYARKYAFNRHLQEHNSNKIHECSRCNKMFLDSWILNDHLCRCKLGQKHQCNVCLKPFPNYEQFLRHKAEHARDRLHTCDVCNKRFRTKQILKQHLRLHPGLMPKCETCKESISDTKRLFDHRDTHTRQKPYQCDLCNKQFSLKSSASRHSRLCHTGLHECNICDKSFNMVDQFIKHLETHLGSKELSDYKKNVEQSRVLQDVEENPNPHSECDVQLLLSLIDQFN